MSALSSLVWPVCRFGAIALGAALPAAAWAHPGHATDGLLAGILHPLTGVDHLFATLGVGALAGWTLVRRMRERVANKRPPSAVDGPSGGWLAAGAAIGILAGLALSAAHVGDPGFTAGIELSAALSLGMLALLILGVERLPTALLATALVLVTLPHAYLHGTESTSASFASGLALASAALLGVGYGAGARAAYFGDRWRRVAQSATATGLALFSAGLVLA